MQKYCSSQQSFQINWFYKSQFGQSVVSQLWLNSILFMLMDSFWYTYNNQITSITQIDIDRLHEIPIFSLQPPHETILLSTKVKRVPSLFKYAANLFITFYRIDFRRLSIKTFITVWIRFFFCVWVLVLLINKLIGTSDTSIPVTCRIEMDTWSFTDWRPQVDATAINMLFDSYLDPYSVCYLPSVMTTTTHKFTV